MSLAEQINTDIKSAMLAKEKEKLEALRAIKAQIMLAKTEKGGNSDVSDDDVLKIVQKLVKQRKESAEVYNANGREELAQKESFEGEVISQYLPAQLSEAEVEAAVKQIATEVGATGPQDMGKVMGIATKKLGGQAEGKLIAGIVKYVLASL